MNRSALLVGIALALAMVAVAPLAAAPPSQSLEHVLGRNEVRVFAAAHRIRRGDTLKGSVLPDRLSARGYRRVRAKPTRSGEFFWGFERFWVYLRASSLPGRRGTSARLVEIALDRRTGRVESLRLDGSAESLAEVTLEPVLLAESLSEQRAPRRWVRFDEFPEHTWRAVLAIEDARFFEHGGVDPRSVARAVLKNAKAGKVTQGGSTITQQLVKIRDLTPRRTLGRKVSEALRAVALEAEYEKRTILEAYLNSVYMGHAEGVSMYGFDAAARSYFGKRVSELSLGESALLAAMIQGPNRLHPRRHPERSLARQRLVLDRLGELGWSPSGDLERARNAGLPRLRSLGFESAILPSTLAWVRDDLEGIARRRAEGDRGLIVETTLDSHLQVLARSSVENGLARIERRLPRSARAKLGAALVALDGTSGDVLAVVGGNPARHDDYDRSRHARRQPGSTVKPFILLEAFERCGARKPLYASRRVIDRALTLELPGKDWSPVNPDGRYRGVVDLRTALVDSLNVPLVRVARWCGFDATAERFRSAGFELPEAPPPSFALGAVEVAPVELASAFTTFVDLGKRHRPRLIERASTASGRGLGRGGRRDNRVTRAATAYLVRDLLREAGARSIGSVALDGHEIIGKTGTSSERKDAWFVGAVGPMVAVVWVGLDDGSPLGLTGSQAAVPIWRDFATASAPALRSRAIARPRGVVERWVDPETGRRKRSPRGGARRELFRDGDEPPRGGLLFRQPSDAPIE